MLPTAPNADPYSVNIHRHTDADCLASHRGRLRKPAPLVWHSALRNRKRLV